ncbi:MAG: TolC family protein [Nitrospirae bacterium]|nr:TolC family protein [Nitrospirota bacterium]
MFRSIAFVLVSLFVAGEAFAADPPSALSRPALTLERCIETALANNQLLRAARADVAAKEGLVIQARSPLLPQITGSVARSESESEGVTGKTTTETIASSLSASQLIYDFGKTYGSLGAAKANREASRGGLEKTIQDVVLSVKQAYYAHIIAKTFVSVQEAVLTSAQAHLKQATAFFEVGVRPRYDVTQDEVEVNNALLGLSTARNNVRLSRITLNNAMGIDPNAPAEIDEALADRKEMPSLDESTRAALASRPEIRQADAQVEAARQSLRAAQGRYWPTISATGSYTWNDGTADSARLGGKSDLGNSWSAQVGLSIPLFEGFGAHGKVREAEANLEAAQANRENLKQGVLLDVNQAHANLDDARVRVTLTESNLKKAKENMDLAKGRYEAGVGAIIEVTDANTSLVKAETDSLQALGDLQLAIARLERAMGRR